MIGSRYDFWFADPFLNVLVKALEVIGKTYKLSISGGSLG